MNFSAIVNVISIHSRIVYQIYQAITRTTAIFLLDCPEVKIIPPLRDRQKVPFTPRR
jgi:hypothetical protein